MRRAMVVLVATCVQMSARDAAALDPSRRVSQYVDRHFGTRDGLPHNLANSLVQTEDGYLWVGSEEGIARFDGAHFTRFDRRDGLPTNTLAALAIDAAGSLWAGTRDRGVVQLRDGGFHAPDDPSAVGLQVRALASDHDGNVWIGTRDHGVTQLHDGRVIATLRAPEALPSDDVRSIRVGRDGTVWIGTFGGVARVGAGPHLPAVPELAGTIVHAIAEDAHGDVWFGTHGQLVHYHAGTFTVEPSPLPGVDVTQLLVDRDDNVWIGMAEGLARRTPDGRIEQLRAFDSRVLALLEDREGDLWIGDEHGLDRLSDGDMAPIGAPEGLTDKQLYSVLEDSTGAIWAAGVPGLYRMAPGEAATNLAPDRGTIYSTYEDAHGDIWAGARDGGLARWHAGRLDWLGTGPWEKLRVIAGSGPDALWLGTDHGLFRLHGSRLTDAVAILPGPIISAIATDARGTLWLGTEGNGLRRIDGVGAGALAIPDGGPPASSSITTLTFEPDGALWVGTEGDGLWLLRGDLWTAFTSNVGMFDDLVWRILDDGNGSLWMSSNRGIWRVQREQLEAFAAGGAAKVDSVAYGEADGMRDRECNGAVASAGWRGRDGRLWFPTGSGLAVVDPHRLHSRTPPWATIERARIDGVVVPPDLPLVLPPGSERLEIEYSAPALRSPEAVRFRYRLEGFDTTWNEAGVQRIAAFTNLAPGTYRFAVEASVDGIWGRERQVEVTLEPHFYQTLGFELLAGLAAVLAILAIPVIRVRQAQARERALAARVQEALKEVKVLSGMLPICAWCKKIRDDQGYWSKLEKYLGERTGAQFTHGICPDCVVQMEAAED